MVVPSSFRRHRGGTDAIDPLHLLDRVPADAHLQMSIEQLPKDLVLRCSDVDPILLQERMSNGLVLVSKFALSKAN